MSLNAFLSNPKAKRLLGFPATAPTNAAQSPVEPATEPQATHAPTLALEAPKSRAKGAKKT